MNFKKTILVDLDGVLNEYNGVFDAKYIPKIRKGATEFTKNLSENYEIKIFTTRNKLLTSKWLIENDLDLLINDVTSVKEPAFLYIDDRAITFNGNYDEIVQKISTFKVWYK